jgi:2-isopropylmalate synthase
MGYSLEPDEINVIFTQFKELADKKKNIQDEDLEALVTERVLRANDVFEMGDIQISCGNTFHPMAGVTIRQHGVMKGPIFTSGNGPIDAVFNAIMQLTGMCPELLRFTVSAITGGTDAQGEVTVRIKDGENVALGRGADLDIVTASARAFINGLNRLVSMQQKPERSRETI